MGLLEQLLVDAVGADDAGRLMTAARARASRAVTRPCPFGVCALAVDPANGTVLGGTGDPGCGCATLPGWRATRYAGLPRPGWPGTPRGRRGSRIQRSRRRHRR